MKVIKFKQFVNEAVAMPAAPVIPVVAAGNTPARDAVVNDCLATIYITMYKAMSTFVAEAKKEKFDNSIIPTEEEWYLAQKKFLSETSGTVQPVPAKIGRMSSAGSSDEPSAFDQKMQKYQK